MNIEYVKGDFIAGPETIILHGCNAQGVMGRGVAKQIKEQMPFAFRAYRDAWNEDDFLPLGSIVWAINTDLAVYPRPRIVGNLITQEWWQPEKAMTGRNVDYDAVRVCFQEVNQLAMLSQTGAVDIFGITPITRIGMPMIGYGLGGGDWTIISKIIEEESVSFVPVVYKL